MENSGTLARSTSVKNELGMHARPASQIAKLAETATSDIWLCVNSKKVDATSIIDILTLSAVKGTKVIVEIKNASDRGIMDRIVAFFEDGFGET